MNSSEIIMLIIASILCFLVIMYIIRHLLGFQQMIKNQQATMKILVEIAKKQGVSEDTLDGIKNEINSNN